MITFYGVLFHEIREQEAEIDATKARIEALDQALKKTCLNSSATSMTNDASIYRLNKRKKLEYVLSDELDK